VIKLKGDEAIATPHKKTQKTEITELKKQENKELSSRRIGVEHLELRYLELLVTGFVWHVINMSK